MRHYHEKLHEQEHIDFELRVALSASRAGLVHKRRKRVAHRRATAPPGMLLPIDGSKDRWLNDDRWYDLMVILDDATSDIY